MSSWGLSHSRFSDSENIINSQGLLKAAILAARLHSGPNTFLPESKIHLKILDSILSWAEFTLATPRRTGRGGDSKPSFCLPSPGLAKGQNGSHCNLEQPQVSVLQAMCSIKPRVKSYPQLPC